MLNKISSHLKTLSFFLLTRYVQLIEIPFIEFFYVQKTRLLNVPLFQEEQFVVFSLYVQYSTISWLPLLDISHLLNLKQCQKKVRQ